MQRENLSRFIIKPMHRTFLREPENAYSWKLRFIHRRIGNNTILGSALRETLQFIANELHQTENDRHSDGLLHAAARFNNVIDLVELLRPVNSEAAPKHEQILQHSLVAVAACGNIDAVKDLIAQGASPKKPSVVFGSALGAAAYGGEENTVT
jgi:hypothetical protein